MTWHRVVAIAVGSMLLNGCGGGSLGATGTNSASGSAPVASRTVNALLSLALANGVANQVTIFSAATSAIRIVRCVDPTGAAVAGTTIPFTPNLPVPVRFLPSSGTGIMDKSG